MRIKMDCTDLSGFSRMFLIDNSLLIDPGRSYVVETGIIVLFFSFEFINRKTCLANN